MNVNDNFEYKIAGPEYDGEMRPVWVIVDRHGEIEDAYYDINVAAQRVEQLNCPNADVICAMDFYDTVDSVVFDDLEFENVDLFLSPDMFPNLD